MNPAASLRQAAEGLLEPVAHHLGGHAHPLEHRQHDPLGLAEEGGEQVLGRDLGVAAVPGLLLGGGDRLLGLAGEPVRVERHARLLLASRGSRGCGGAPGAGPRRHGVDNNRLKIDVPRPAPAPPARAARAAGGGRDRPGPGRRPGTAWCGRG